MVSTRIPVLWLCPTPLVWETPHGVPSGTPELPGAPRSAPAGAHLCRGLLRPGHVVPAEPLAHLSAQRDVAPQCRPDRRFLCDHDHSLADQAGVRAPLRLCAA